MDEWIEAMEADELAPKTINNTLGTLVVCLNDAVEDGLIAPTRRCGSRVCRQRAPRA